MRVQGSESSRQSRVVWRRFYAILTYAIMLLALWGVFVYVPTEKVQGIVQRIFYFHVSSAITMSLAFFVVFVASIVYLSKASPWWDNVASSSAEIGILFCTLVLITGPIWARPIWNTWWVWFDATLVSTLVLWLIYVAYLMLRADAHDARRARMAAVVGIIGFVMVPIIRWSVEKWSMLHPKPVIAKEGAMPPSMILTFLISLAAFWLLFFFLLRERVSIAQSHDELDALRYQVDRDFAGWSS